LIDHPMLVPKLHSLARPVHVSGYKMVHCHGTQYIITVQ
jgi:hypothetical protein